MKKIFTGLLLFCSGLTLICSDPNNDRLELEQKLFALQAEYEIALNTLLEVATEFNSFSNRHQLKTVDIDIDNIHQDLQDMKDQASVINKYCDTRIKKSIKLVKENLKETKDILQKDSLINESLELYSELLNKLSGNNFKKISETTSLKDFQELIENRTKASTEIKILKNTLIKKLNQNTDQSKKTINFEAILDFLNRFDPKERLIQSEETINRFKIEHTDDNNPELLTKILTIAKQLGINTNQVQFKITDSIGSAAASSSEPIEHDKKLYCLNTIFINPNEVKNLTDSEIAGMLLHEATHFHEPAMVGCITSDIIDIQQIRNSEINADLAFMWNNEALSLQQKIEIAESMYDFFKENKHGASLLEVKASLTYPSSSNRAKNFKQGIRMLLKEPGAFHATPKTWISMTLFDLLPIEKNYLSKAVKTPAGVVLIIATTGALLGIVYKTCKKLFLKRQKHSEKTHV